ncbi:transposase [Streptomyces sp. YIM B13518]|uniref:transposase n=1 Tax=Streptomyces sp. YIM B13518 TaxID=3366316 RepID=UPI0036C3FAE1
MPVRDSLNTHVSRTMQNPVAEREWLRGFPLPAYSPDLNPVDGVWAHVKGSLANLAVVALERLEALVRNRLERPQCRPGALDGFMTGAGPTLDAPASPRRADISDHTNSEAGNHTPSRHQRHPSVTEGRQAATFPVRRGSNL